MMKRCRRWLPLAAAAFTLFLAGCAGTSGSIPYEQGAERYEFKFALTKAPAETGTCTASASVRDRRSGRRIVIPIFTAPWGKETGATAQDTEYGARLDVNVVMTDGGESGSFTAALRRGDQLIASRTANINVKIVRPNLTPG